MPSGPELYSVDVSTDHPVPIEPEGGTATVTVDQTGGTVYWADNPQVSAQTNQGSIAPGGSQTFTNPVWLRASAPAGVSVQVTSVWDQWSGSPPGSHVWSMSAPGRQATDLMFSKYDSGPTDQTAGFLAAHADAANLVGNGAAKVRIILDNRQKYTIGGPVQAGANGQWAQIPLPWSSTSRGVIQLVGIPRGNDDGYITNTSSTVIESTLASAPAYVSSRGIASIFGGPASFCSGHSGGSLINQFQFSLQDVTIRSASPVICGIDAGFLTGFTWDGLLQFDTDWAASLGTLVVCTNPQAIPVIFPFYGDSYGTLGDTLVCTGWLGGPMLGEVAHVKRVVTFLTAGAALYVDNSTQISRIDYLIDWNNAYGIASTNPGSATPISPLANGTVNGSQRHNSATPVHIGSWNVQTTVAGGGVPNSTVRVADVLDASVITPVDAVWACTTDAEVGVAAPIIVGSGGSTTGYTSYKTIVNLLQQTLPFTSGAAPAVPVSTVAIRNPFGRPCLVQISGGTVTAVLVDTVSQPLLSMVMVPANAIISLTYSVAPTWSWQAF